MVFRFVDGPSDRPRGGNIKRIGGIVGRESERIPPRLPTLNIFANSLSAIRNEILTGDEPPRV